MTAFRPSGVGEHFPGPAIVEFMPRPTRPQDAGRDARRPAGPPRPEKKRPKRQSDLQKQLRPVWPILTGAGCAALLAAAAVLLSYRVEPPPDNARVVTDTLRMTYASTPCVVFNKLDREMIANRTEVSDPSKPLQLFSYASEKTIADVKTDGKWTRDATCDFATGFDQIVTRWMRLTGYRTRWTDEGQWRW